MLSEFEICNPNLCKSHTFWNTANIEKWPFFAWWPKLMKSEKLPEILSWGNFCVVNSNLQPKIYVNSIYFELQLILKAGLFRYLITQIDEIGKIVRNFWNTANIENPFFAYADLITKIDEIGKIARNSFIG